MNVDKIYKADKKALKKSIALTVIGSIIGICILLKICDDYALMFVLATMYGPMIYLAFYNGLVSEIIIQENHIGFKLIGEKGFSELYWSKVTMIEQIYKMEYI